MKRKIILGTLIGLGLLGWIGFKIWMKIDEQKQLDAISGNGQNMTVNIPTVKVLAATHEAIQETLHLVGNIQAEENLPFNPVSVAA